MVPSEEPGDGQYGYLHFDTLLEAVLVTVLWL